MVGRNYGEEFKYPLRFSEDVQTGPTRETVETSGNISEKAGEAIEATKEKVHKVFGNVEDKNTMKWESVSQFVSFLLIHDLENNLLNSI